MTEQHPDRHHELAADSFAGLSSSDFADMFELGFLAYARGDSEAAAAAFGPAYAHLFVDEDITSDLASTYRVLSAREASSSRSGADRAFLKGLLAAFERMNITISDHRVALKLMLQLAARTQCRGILALLPRSVFDQKLVPSSEIMDLRESAFEAVLALTQGNADAGDHLRDIARTKAFNADNVDDLLFALCFAEPDDLLAHLILLEDPLAEIYGSASVEPEHDLLYRRTLLLTDIGGNGYFRPSVLGDVADLALVSPNWRLAWIGRTLVEPIVAEIDDEEREKAEQLLDMLLKGRSKPARIPAGMRLSQIAGPSPEELREAFELLSAVDPDEGKEQSFLLHMLEGLTGAAIDANEIAGRSGTRG